MLQPAPAQEISLHAGNTLTYQVNENNEKNILTFQINSLQPHMMIDWKKNNKFRDFGNFSITQDAIQNAINILFSLTSTSEQTELFDQLPGFIISKSMFEKIKLSKKARIRTDCNLRAEDLIFKKENKIHLMVNGKASETGILKLSFGNFNDELWILDNPDFPLVVKMKGLNSWELTGIN